MRRTLSSGLPFSGSDVYVTWIFITLNPPNVLRSKVDRLWVHFAANLELGLELAKSIFSCFSLRHDEARKILLDQVMDCFIHSGLSRANGMPGNLKEVTYCCLGKCRKDGSIVKYCNYLFFLVRTGVEFQMIRVMMKNAKPTLQVYCFVPHQELDTNESLLKWPI